MVIPVRQWEYMQYVPESSIPGRLANTRQEGDSSSDLWQGDAHQTPPLATQYKHIPDVLLLNSRSETHWYEIQWNSKISLILLAIPRPFLAVSIRFLKQYLPKKPL
jgi:lipopolysaccharide export LptBFGC system permease protein LptF